MPKAPSRNPGHQAASCAAAGKRGSGTSGRRRTRQPWPFLGLAPGAAKSFQPKSMALARAANRRRQPPRRLGEPPPGRGAETLSRASLSPRRPPRFTYHRAGRRAAAGRVAVARAVASGAAAGARPRGEKRRKVVLCRLRDTAEPAPGSAPFPTLPPARSHACPQRLPQPWRLRLWAAAAGGPARASLTPSS